MLASSVDQSDASTSAASPAQKTKEQVQRHYVRALHKVINESDIVTLVLDARDPEGCRSSTRRRGGPETGKRRREARVRPEQDWYVRALFLVPCVDTVLMLLDLVPRENAQRGSRHLRHYTPTLLFRSAVSNQRSNLSRARHQRSFGS